MTGHGYFAERGDDATLVGLVPTVLSRHRQVATTPAATQLRRASPAVLRSPARFKKHVFMRKKDF